MIGGQGQINFMKKRFVFFFFFSITLPLWGYDETWITMGNERLKSSSAIAATAWLRLTTPSSLSFSSCSRLCCCCWSASEIFDLLLCIDFSFLSREFINFLLSYCNDSSATIKWIEDTVNCLNCISAYCFFMHVLDRWLNQSKVMRSFFQYLYIIVYQ